ncbi:chloramphenicol acetyltransferase [Bacillus rubiinfantis]|uniref:chloramphenicol acetyltransferase n=1 Tax=Bacillus rubiinfantis TaxID=1499680 RepID=UPI0005A8CFAA|nr:chloramphenicol acetyltransferase [Bacillus rubiinfantis]
MKYIDVETWKRRKHFELYRSMDFPHLNLTANVDVTDFYKKIKAQRLSFFKAFLFGAVKTANEITEFRYRIRGDKVVEHERVHPSFTVMTSDDLFSFCTVAFEEEFSVFLQEVSRKMERAEQEVNLEDEEGVDNLLYITCIPWVSFTNILHPIHLSPADSVPRIAWGKFFEENGKIKLPVSVQAHHALVDGVHMGKFYLELQKWLNHTENYTI